MSKKAMDIHNERNVDTPEPEGKETRSCVRLVGYGEGLPYAPENWPNPGDLWGWKIEKKLTIFGYHLERHLYLPESLYHLVDVPAVLKNGFTSKSSLRRFLHMHFPHFDVDVFFDSFSWRILSTHAAITGCGNGSLSITGNIDNHGTNFDIMPILDHPSDVMSNTSACKAGNAVCSSLKESIDSPPLVAAQCSVCCTEPKFCGDCCCILCSKIVDPSHGGYSYIKCQSIVTACLICSHVAHLECALRVYMAGTIGGSIGFDAEYLCRRCNVKTDLVPHTVKAFQACRQIDSRDEIEKILTMCICILRGTQKDHGRDLLKRIEAAARKLKRGTTLEDIWEADAPADNIFNKKPSLGSKLHDYNGELLKIDVEINDVLHSLRKSQELEYEIVEEKLHVQKKNLKNLYRQLRKEHSALARLQSETARDAMWNTVISRVDMIDREWRKLAHVKKVVKGFGMTSEKIYQELFG